MNFLKYIIIILIAATSIIVGCKHKSNNTIHFSGHVLDDTTFVGIEGADIYLCTLGQAEDTVARAKSGADGSFDISVIKNGDLDFGIYIAKKGYIKKINSDRYSTNKSEYKDLNFYLYSLSFLQLHFQCVSNDSIIGTFYADYFGGPHKAFKYKNNTDTTFIVETMPYYNIMWDVPISITRNGVFSNITYPINFTNYRHDTTKMNILIK